VRETDDPGRYILDADGQPVLEPDLLTWGAWLERASRDRSRVIAQDRDEGDPAHVVTVSTVFLGLDHRFGGAGPPILWESLIFGGVLDGQGDRYTSRAAALAGHQRLCERVAATIHRPPTAEPTP
jgi:hypothetical protein